MGLFGGKDDTQAKIEELKAKMQGGQQPQQGWQPQQPWQQPQQQPYQPQPQYHEPELPRQQHRHHEEDADELGIVLDLGEGMSLNLPIRSRMRLDEFLKVADRVRELKKIESQHRY